MDESLDDFSLSFPWICCCCRRCRRCGISTSSSSSSSADCGDAVECAVIVCGPKEALRILDKKLSAISSCSSSSKEKAGSEGGAGCRGTEGDVVEGGEGNHGSADFHAVPFRRLTFKIMTGIASSFFF